jgi:hypothetical protein
MYMHRKYLLFAQPNSYIFTLKQEGQSWLREFNSIFDAITYASSLPDSGQATLAVFDSAGSRLAELRVREDTFATV